MNILIKTTYVALFWIIFIIIKIATWIFYILPIKYLLLITVKRNRILFLDPFFEENAGTFYREKKWAELLEKQGIKVVIKNVYNKQTFNKLLSTNDNIVLFHLGFIVKRLYHFFFALSFKTVIVRRTILLYNEYGNGNFMEKLLMAIHPNVILDFDDDMQIQEVQEKPSVYGKILLENRKKFYNNLNLYNRFIVGSEYLKTLVLKYNSHVILENIIVIPTCVDYEQYKSKEYIKNNVITFGWIGSNSNLIYVDYLIKPLNNVAKKNRIKLLIISGKEYFNEDADFEIVNINWSLESEKENLLKIDIGLMPLFNTPMEKGKCGFKLIQYMGLGIVSVASAITVNKEIIDDEINGFLVKSEDDWEDVLNNVITKWNEFASIGEKARKKINLKYSFSYYINTYVNFVKSYKLNIGAKEKTRIIVSNILYYCYYIFIKSSFEKTRNNKQLKPGITAVISAKNEEVSIEMSLMSLLGFADQIVCIDNGSEDSTWKIMNEFKTKYNNRCKIEILSMPKALLGDCRDAGLERTEHQWHLRWDADMVFKTSGNESSHKLRERVLKTKRALAFQLPRVNLYGDFHHTSKFYDVIDRGEPFLIKFSKKIKYVEHGKFDIIKLPIYYKIKKITNTYIFHCDGIKPSLRLIYRNCYFDWRQKYNSVNDKNKLALSDFKEFEKNWQLNRYKTNDLNSLIFRHQKEYLLHYKKYDPEIYSEYPDIIENYINSGKERFKILYSKNGKPYIRVDSDDPTIKNYIPNEDDINFNPLIYLKEVLINNDYQKMLTEYLCVESLE